MDARFATGRTFAGYRGAVKRERRGCYRCVTDVSERPTAWTNIGFPAVLTSRTAQLRAVRLASAAAQRYPATSEGLRVS